MRLWPSEAIHELLRAHPMKETEVADLLGYSGKMVRGTLYNLRAGGHARFDRETGLWHAIGTPFQRYTERSWHPRRKIAA